MAEKITLELKRDDACLWLHVTNGQQHGAFNLGSGLRKNGQDVLAVQVLRECIAHYAALSQSSTNPKEIGSRLVDGEAGIDSPHNACQYREQCRTLRHAERARVPDAELRATLQRRFFEVGRMGGNTIGSKHRAEWEFLRDLLAAAPPQPEDADHAE